MARERIACGTVLLADAAARGTFPGRVAWINKNNRNPDESALVGDLGLKITKGPGVQVSALAFSSLDKKPDSAKMWVCVTTRRSWNEIGSGELSIERNFDNGTVSGEPGIERSFQSKMRSIGLSIPDHSNASRRMRFMPRHGSRRYERDWFPKWEGNAFAVDLMTGELCRLIIFTVVGAERLRAIITDFTVPYSKNGTKRNTNFCALTATRSKDTKIRSTESHVNLFQTLKNVKRYSTVQCGPGCIAPCL
jgi:hypothetical protein